MHIFFLQLKNSIFTDLCDGVNDLTYLLKCRDKKQYNVEESD